MPSGRITTLFFLLIINAWGAAQFREYYRPGERAAPQEEVAPMPQPTPRRVQPQTQTAQPTPVVQRRPTIASAPTAHFGFGGNWFVRASVGAVSQSRAVSVQTDTSGVDVYYKPDNTLMGMAEGNTLTHNANELFFRPQIGFGYQWPREGNFWTLDFYTTSDLQETLLNYAWTLPSRAFSSTIPYLKLIGGVGHVDAEGLAPTSFSVGAGAGAYNWLDNTRHWRLEYGIDYTRREWLPINHSYGIEEWVDSEWHLYLGTAWRF